MIGFLIAIFLIWLGYRLYKASKEPEKQQDNLQNLVKNKQESFRNISYNGFSFGYYKNHETERDLI